jgi:hypothetical protein
MAAVWCEHEFLLKIVSGDVSDSVFSPPGKSVKGLLTYWPCPYCPLGGAEALLLLITGLGGSVDWMCRTMGSSYSPHVAEPHTPQALVGWGCAHFSCWLSLCSPGLCISGTFFLPPLPPPR